MKRKNQTRAASFANQLRRSRRFRAVQSRPVVGASPSDVAAICHVSIATAKSWLSDKTRFPHYALVLLAGDLGAMSQGWKGWRVEGDSIITPKGLMISRSELEAAPGLMEQIDTLQEELAALRSKLAALRCKAPLEEQPLPD